jgi:hypothetical protein
MLPEGIKERRSKPRIEGSFPATLRGTTISGESFQIDARLDNLSVSGLHVCLECSVAVASPLYAVIRLPGIEVRAQGVVKRVETRRDGLFGLGVALENYRVFSAERDTARGERKLQ